MGAEGREQKSGRDIREIPAVFRNLSQSGVGIPVFQEGLLSRNFIYNSRSLDVHVNFSRMIVQRL